MLEMIGRKQKENGRQVITKYGTIEGVRLVNDNDYQIDAFLGIPFAKPPIGPLRFKVKSHLSVFFPLF